MKIIFTLLATFFLIIHSNSQPDFYIKSLLKYWSYRYRLIGDQTAPDYWSNGGFLKVGIGPGCSLPASQLNSNQINSNWSWIYNPSGDFGNKGPCTNQGIYPDNTGADFNNPNHLVYPGVIQWGDQPTSLGLYLAVLATEWTELHKYAQNTNRTEIELYDALEAVNRLDLYAEKVYYGGQSGTINQQPGSLNGFFYRDDVPWDFARGQNFSSQFENVSSGGSCTDEKEDCDRNGQYKWWTHDYESKDQMIKLLYGLAFVVKLLPAQGVNNPNLPSSDLKGKAREIADRLVSYVNADPLWRIKDPDGDKVCRGNNALVYSWAIAESANKISMWGNYYLQYHNAASRSLGRTSWRAQKLLYWFFYGLGNRRKGLLGINDDMFGDLAVMMFGSSKKVIATLGTAIGHPEYDLARAVLDDYNGYYSNSNLYYTSGSPFRNYLSGGDCNNPPPDKLYNYENGLMYMLLFNLYSMVFQPPVIDLGRASPFEYPNLLDREVTATYPLSTQYSPRLGTTASPLTVQAVYHMDNSAKLLPGAHVDFFAPHIMLSPGFTAANGSTSLIEPRKINCSKYYDVMLLGGDYWAGKKDEELIEDSDETPYVDSTQLAEFKAYLSGDTDVIPGFIKDLLNDTTLYNELTDNTPGLFNITVYPNPFSTACNVILDLPISSTATMCLYNMQGVCTLTVFANEELTEGRHSFSIDRGVLSAGVYALVYQDNTGHSKTTKIIIK